jgi:Domain of Unknown Function (DUF928)
VNIPTEEDDESLGADSDRVVRYSEDLRPLRDVDEPRVYHGSTRRRDWADRQLHLGPVLAAAAAGFLIAIVFGPCHRTDPLREGELANLKSELQTAHDRVGQLESELASKHESVGTPDAPDERSASEREEQTAPAPSKREQKSASPAASEHEQQAAPAPKKKARSELTPDEVLRLKEMAANSEAVEEAAPAAAAPVAAEAAPPAPTAPAPSPEPSPPPPQAEPEPAARTEPLQVASVYDIPDPAAPVVRASSRSGTPGVAVLRVLAPERAGWTTKAQPTLYWHASEGTLFPGEFTLSREGEDEPLVRGQFPAPAKAGIQQIELSQFAVSLDEGTSYRWAVSFADPAHSGEDLAIAGIRRVTPPEALQATDSAPVLQRLDALERAGLWYDALDLVVRSIEHNPGDKDLLARRSALLARVGIQLPSS